MRRAAGSGSGISSKPGPASRSISKWSIVPVVFICRWMARRSCSIRNTRRRELGVFLLYDTAREAFIRAEVYNLRRNREYSSYPVYWAGHITNEESLNYLKSLVDAPAPEINRLAERATFAIALHDDARVDPMLIEMIRRPIAEPTRSRAIYWLGNTPETAAKNTLFAEIVRHNE